MRYTVLIVLTDGEPKDTRELLQELANASHSPISVIIVGMGEADLPSMPQLQDDLLATHRLLKTELPTASRNVVTYVAQKDHSDAAHLAKAMLQTLPSDMLAYYEACNIKPRKLDTFEDSAGTPVPRPVIDVEAREKRDNLNRAPAERETSGSRNGTSSNPGTKETVGNQRTLSGTKSSSVQQSSERTLSSQKEGGDDVGGSKSSAADDFIRKKREMERHLASLPAFLKDEREELVRKAARHGYPKHAIERALKEGVPTAGFDVLVDNLTHCRNGTGLPMKEAALQAVAQVSKRVTSQTTVSKVRRQSNSNSKLPTSNEHHHPISRNASVRSVESRGSQAAIGDSQVPGALEADAGSCRVCLERPVNTEFVPCGHRLACSVCAEKLGPVCLLCKGTVTMVRKLEVGKRSSLPKLVDGSVK